MLSFLGGFSSAASMVFVATIALATMVSNHIVVPIWLTTRNVGEAKVSGDVRYVTLLSRRLSIAGVLLLGYLYYRVSGGGTALAAIGLVSFTGAVQVLPSFNWWYFLVGGHASWGRNGLDHRLRCLELDTVFAQLWQWGRDH